MATLTPDEVLESVDQWTLLQINEFVEKFCEKYNVSASAPVAVAAAGGGEAAATEEQTEFTVTLTEVGGEKIKVIKEIRSINPALGLKEAKAVVDAVPAEIVKDVPKDEAEKIKAQIEAVGAKAEIK